MTATTIVLVRHGRTAWGDERYAGTSDISLDATGLQQAEVLASWAATQHFTLLVCSPLGRAGQTAAAVAAETGLEPRIEADLRELGFGVAEGRTLLEMRDTDPAAADAFLADPGANPWPGGEDPAAAAGRAADCIRRLARQRADGHVLAVTHRTIIRLALCDLLGLPVSRYRSVFRRLEPASATALEIADESAGLLSYNVAVA